MGPMLSPWTLLSALLWYDVQSCILYISHMNRVTLVLERHNIAIFVNKTIFNIHFSVDVIHQSHSKYILDHNCLLSLNIFYICTALKSTTSYNLKRMFICFYKNIATQILRRLMISSGKCVISTECLHVSSYILNNLVYTFIHIHIYGLRGYGVQWCDAAGLGGIIRFVEITAGQIPWSIRRRHSVYTLDTRGVMSHPWRLVTIYGAYHWPSMIQFSSLKYTDRVEVPCTMPMQITNCGWNSLCRSWRKIRLLHTLLSIYIIPKSSRVILQT